MAIATINWDAIELLPRFLCCVCAETAVPWGRTLDDRFFCSKICSETHAHAASAPPPQRSSRSLLRARGARAGYRGALGAAAKRFRCRPVSMSKPSTANDLVARRAA